jgi:hypothetical protein
MSFWVKLCGHARAHTHIQHTHKHTHTPAQAQAKEFGQAEVWMNERMMRFTETCTHARTRTHTHPQMHTNTHKYTQIHTLAQAQAKEFGQAEAWMNERMMRFSGKSVAEFITAFDGGSSGGKRQKNSPLDNDVWLVWK